MNLAHIHLILNHIPVVGIPIAMVFLAYGLCQKNAPAQRFALLVLIGLAAVVLPVYFTGEPAEKVIEHLPGVAESFIESHEDAAMFSLILTILSGVSACVALWFQGDPKKSRMLNLSVMGTACLSVLSLVYTANLGGKVRHTELRSGSAIQTSGKTEDISKTPKL